MEVNVAWRCHHTGPCCDTDTTRTAKPHRQKSDTQTRSRQADRLTGWWTSSGAAEGQNVASRGAFEIHMARFHSPGRGPTRKSFQISVKGAFQFCCSLRSEAQAPPRMNKVTNGVLQRRLERSLSS